MVRAYLSFFTLARIKHKASSELVPNSSVHTFFNQFLGSLVHPRVKPLFLAFMLLLVCLSPVWATQTKLLEGKARSYVVNQLQLDPQLEYQYLIQDSQNDSTQSTEASQEIIILHRGTEAGRLDVKEHYQALDQLIFEQKFETKDEHKYRPSPYKSMDLFHWPAVSFIEAVEKNASWGDGLTLRAQLEETGIHNRAYSNFITEVTWIQEWNKFHAGLMYGQHSTGGFTRMVVNPAYTLPIGNNSTWAFILGYPGIRLRFDYYVPSRPRHGYLEMDSLALKRQVPSEVIKEEYYYEVFGTPPYTTTTSIELKYSHLYYIMRRNSQLYLNSIHEAGIRDLSIPFGRWGANCTWSGPSFILGLNYQFGPSSFTNVGYKNYRSDIEWIPLDLSIKMNSFKHLYLSLATQLYFSNPFSGGSS